MEQQVNSRAQAYQDVKMFVANGWTLKEETPESFIVTRNEASKMIHLLLALFFWWLFFVPNIVYHFMSNKKRIILK